MVDDTMPVWAPKGDRIAFIGRYEAYESELYTISSTGKQVRRVTDNLYEDFLPQWQPDGKGVLFSGFVRGRPPEIFISDPMSPEKKQLTDNFDVEMGPAFSPDGKKLLFIRRNKGRDNLYIMDMPDKRAKQDENTKNKERKFFPNGFTPAPVPATDGSDQQDMQ
jgi:TolB protein